MVGGALLFGVALHPVTAMAPLAGGLLGIATGAAIGYGRPGWRLVPALVALIPLLVMTPSWPMLTGVAAILSVGLLAGGPRGVRGLLALLLGAITALVAMWCALRIGQANQTVHWPAIATTATSAAAMGIVGVLAMLPRHLQLVSDPVHAAVRKLPVNLDAEVRDLCARSAAIWTAAQDRIRDDAGKALRGPVGGTL